MAYDLEQALNARQQPQLLGAITPIRTGDSAAVIATR